MAFFRYQSSNETESEGITFKLPYPPVGYVKTFFVFTALFLIGGAALYFWAYPGLRSALLTKDWIPTEGRITVSELNKTPNNKGVVFSYPRIEYEYSIGEAQYTGDTVSLWQTPSGDINQSEKTLAFYSKGKTITIYYNLENHFESVLEPGSWKGSLLVFLLCSFFASVGLYGLVVTLRDLMTGKPRPSIVIIET